MEAVRGGRKSNHQDEERHDRQQAYEPDVESHRPTSGTVKSFACISAPLRTAASPGLLPSIGVESMQVKRNQLRLECKIIGANAPGRIAPKLVTAPWSPAAAGGDRAGCRRPPGRMGWGSGHTTFLPKRKENRPTP
jgi:hypothetical protein